MGEGDTLLNALVGAVVTVFTTGVVAPVAPIVGGAVSGYLEGGDRSDGVRVGAFGGAIALVPLVLFLVLLGNLLFLVFSAGDAPTPALGGVSAVVLVFLFLSAAIYVVALSALGGWLGNYLRADTNLGSTGSRGRQG
jgi:hypothetical protein